MTGTLSCNCEHYNSTGYSCRHSLAVIIKKSLPSQSLNIKQRWILKINNHDLIERMQDIDQPINPELLNYDLIERKQDIDQLVSPGLLNYDLIERKQDIDQLVNPGLLIQVINTSIIYSVLMITRKIIILSQII